MELQDANDTALDEASMPFEGRWNRLISTTNWEKGQIVLEWREALRRAEAPVSEYSDESWARRVGGVTGQHIGRLRRVYERFGETHAQFEGLFWSHFQASIDWDDAEMWLEGAIQQHWSVAQMRKSRWEAMGAPAELKPREEDIVSTELDEDLDSREDLPPATTNAKAAGGDDGEPRSPAGPDFGDDDDLGSLAAEPFSPSAGDTLDAATPHAPFQNLADLPSDLADAFESFKLAIIRHRMDGWQEISPEDVIGTLDALKELTLAAVASA